MKVVLLSVLLAPAVALGWCTVFRGLLCLWAAWRVRRSFSRR